MIRKRMIQPNIWQDEDFGLLSPLAQLVYIGCITQADDEGRLIGHPAVIKSIIFPYGLVTLEQVFDALQEIIAKNRNFVYYEVDKNYYIQFKKWLKYQHIRDDRKIKSTFPPQSADTSPQSAAEVKESKVKESKGKDGSGQLPSKNQVLDNLRKNLEEKGIIKKTKLL